MCMEPIQETLPALIKRLRLAYGDSQQQFAERLGLSIRTVAHYESDRIPPVKVLRRMADFAAELNRMDWAAAFRAAQSQLAHDNTATDEGTVSRIENVQQAIRLLRRTLGDSQQEFANRVGVSIGSVVHYEKDRMPPVEVLGYLLALAREIEAPALTAYFNEAFKNKLHSSARHLIDASRQRVPVDTEKEWVWATAAVEILRHEEYEELRPAVEAALKPLFPSLTQAYQKAFEPEHDHKPYVEWNWLPRDGSDEGAGSK